jgi:DNA-binding CsgD family transcriptional regulator
MPKRISLAEHLSVEELESNYRSSNNGIEARQYQILWLLAQGQTPLEVSQVRGYSRTWI